MKVHLIGICGTGMGSLAGLLKAAGPRRARLRRARLPADVRAAGGSEDPVLRGVPPREPGLGPGRGRRRQRLPQGPRRGAGGAGAEHPARIVPVAVQQAVPAGPPRRAAVGRRRGHARQDDDVVAARARADGREARSVVPDRRRAAELPASLAAGRGRRVRRSRATSTTPRSSTRDRSSCTTGRRSCC